MPFTDKTSLYYDDVVLLAKTNFRIKSRKDTKIDRPFIFVAPMTSIVGPEFLKAVNELDKDMQPIVCIPRDKYAEQSIELANTLDIQYAISIGLNTPNLEKLAFESNNSYILLDVANGYLKTVIESTKRLVNAMYKTKANKTLIVGNVHTIEGCVDLKYAFGNHDGMIRLGIGGGAACKTADVTGYTRGSITEIDECHHYNIIADGGIKSTGHICKALMAGARYVMLGRMFADIKESRLQTDSNRTYYGMSSSKGKDVMANESSNYIEGTEFVIPKSEHSLSELMERIYTAVRSAISYSGYDNLDDAIGQGKFEVLHTRLQ